MPDLCNTSSAEKVMGVAVREVLTIQAGSISKIRNVWAGQELTRIFSD